MGKIKVANPVVELDGDEMTRIIWQWVAFLDAEVVIMKVDVEIGEDQPLADPLPDDPGHFVAAQGKRL